MARYFRNWLALILLYHRFGKEEGTWSSSGGSEQWWIWQWWIPWKWRLQRQWRQLGILEDITRTPRDVGALQHMIIGVFVSLFVACLVLHCSNHNILQRQELWSERIKSEQFKKFKHRTQCVFASKSAIVMLKFLPHFPF